MAVYDTAVVSPKAKIADDVEIGPYSVVSGGVEIGAGCRLGPNVTVCEFTTIGSGCEIHSGAVIGDTPQDTGFSGCESYVEIGANCIIRECVTIHRGTDEGSSTVVGDGCFLMACSHVAHNVVLENDVIMANNSMLAGHVHIGEKVFISGGAGVHQFVKVGRMALLGGNCLCAKDVPPFCMVEPCSWSGVKGLNVIGMRRAGMTPEERADVKRVFKILYGSGLNVTQALERIDEMGTAAAREMAEFVRASKRGICGSELSVG